MFWGVYLQDCLFNKTKDDTALRVVYQGNFYTLCGGSERLTKKTTNPDQWRDTVKTFTRGKSVLESTLETAPGTETLMDIQAGIQFPV